MKLKLSSDDPLIISEFILVMLASTFFTIGMFTYIFFTEIYFWVWACFGLCLLVKSYLEFLETEIEP